MYKSLVLFIFLSISMLTSAYSQCSIEVNKDGFEYVVDLDLSISDVIYTQSGSTCNVQIEITYDIQINVTNQPGWWNESLYNLQGNLDCLGASGMSFFDLPNSGGSGTVLSAIFSFSNEDCSEINLDCPIILNIQGPELNYSAECGEHKQVALPVTLNSFNYENISSNKVGLNWNTATEINFSHFEIEHSADLKEWTNLASIQGKNEANGDHYNHSIPTTPFNQYIRLKLVDIDNQYEYSDVLLIQAAENDIISLFPNPTTERLTIEGIEEIKQATIFNSTGQSSSIIVDSNHNIDVSALQPGYYLLQILTTHDSTHSMSFIKQ